MKWQVLLIFCIGLIFLAFGIAGLIDWLVTDLGVEIGTGINACLSTLSGSAFIMISMALYKLDRR